MNDISLMKKATSSEFLQTRIALNKNALNNFEHWSINTMPKIPINSNILDIGCGTGKQLLSFSSFFTKKCTYYGCDISKESLMIIENNYKSKPKLNLINDSFDNIHIFLEKHIKFDLVYSFYSLYYSENLELIINNIFNSLKDGGIFWVVMPYKNTNKELFNILEKIYNIDKKVIYSIDGFSNDVILNASNIGFKDIDISLFENKIFFNTKEELFAYIKNTTFYNEKYNKDIIKAIGKEFKENFSLTKEVISLKFTK